MEAVKYHNNKMKRLIGIKITYTSWEKIPSDWKAFVRFSKVQVQEKRHTIKRAKFRIYKWVWILFENWEKVYAEYNFQEHWEIKKDNKFVSSYGLSCKRPIFTLQSQKTKKRNYFS